jgi:hypothetical protein
LVNPAFPGSRAFEKAEKNFTLDQAFLASEVIELVVGAVFGFLKQGVILSVAVFQAKRRI